MRDRGPVPGATPRRKGPLGPSHRFGPGPGGGRWRVRKPRGVRRPRGSPGPAAQDDGAGRSGRADGDRPPGHARPTVPRHAGPRRTGPDIPVHAGRCLITPHGITPSHAVPRRTGPAGRTVPDRAPRDHFAPCRPTPCHDTPSESRVPREDGARPGERGCRAGRCRGCDHRPARGLTRPPRRACGARARRRRRSRRSPRRGRDRRGRPPRRRRSGTRRARRAARGRRGGCR